MGLAQQRLAQRPGNRGALPDERARLSPALRRLVLAGILRSQCGGTRPGFMLSRPPEEVTMLEVVRALEGSFRMDCCRMVLPGVRCTCDTDSCLVCGVFRDMLDGLRRKLSDVSLEEHAATEEFSWVGGYKALQTNDIACYLGIFQR